MKADFDSSQTIGDWGEFRFLNEILLPMMNALGGPIIGDDCASLPLPGRQTHLIVTSDASPQPLISALGYGDTKVWGWYSVLINASDLAAAGATPLGFTSSVEAPAETHIASLKNFFLGISEACRAFTLASAGGNIREAPRFECHGTAFGMAEGRVPLTRSGAEDGDAIFVIGKLGRFVTAYLNARRFGISNLSENDFLLLTKPYPKLREMETLSRSGLISAATDNSDGILGAIWNVAEKSNVKACLILDNDLLDREVFDVAKREGLDPWNLAFCWGDWQVLVAVRPHLITQFIKIAENNSIEYLRLGHFEKGLPYITASIAKQVYKVQTVRNENFSLHSYNKGAQGQLEYQLKTSLFEPIDQ